MQIFFDRCRVTIEQGFYLEAIFMEYAAIEARIESICGVPGLPGGRNCKCRKDIKISHRIECLRTFYDSNMSVRFGTMLPDDFLVKRKLKTWAENRNRFVYGFFNDETKYKDRITGDKNLNEDGYEHARLLYNEARRLRRIHNNYSSSWSDVVALCKKSSCKGYLDTLQDTLESAIVNNL